MSKKLSFHQIADHPNELSWAENGIAVAELKGKKICLGRFKDEIFAFAYKCPHAGGIMADGYIDALGNVVCPLHRYKFSLQNGRNVSGEGYDLKHWPVEMREGRRQGLLSVGLLSDEVRRYGTNGAKRSRLVLGGATVLIPDFSYRSELIRLLGWEEGSHV